VGEVASAIVGLGVIVLFSQIASCHGRGRRSRRGGRCRPAGLRQRQLLLGLFARPFVGVLVVDGVLEIHHRRRGVAGLECVLALLERCPGGLALVGAVLGVVHHLLKRGLVIVVLAFEIDLLEKCEGFFVILLV